MKISQRFLAGQTASPLRGAVAPDETADLVLAFGSKELLNDGDSFGALRALYPAAHLCGCSTAGEICGTGVFDDTLAATVISFEGTRIMGAGITLTAVSNSKEAGALLARSIEMEGLVHVFVLSDGLNVNGSELVEGLSGSLPEKVTITGGLAADADRFEETYVFWDGPPRQNSLAIVGFYGNHLKVGYGSMGGWDPFGPDRLVTRSSGNVLYEIDGRSVLDLYRRYLGDRARDLPSSGLFFPLCVRTGEGEKGIVRTL